MSLNGHSSAITKDFYVRQERSKDVEHAINAFATITSPRQQANEMFNVSSDSDEFEPAVPSVVAKRKIAIVDEMEYDFPEATNTPPQKHHKPAADLITSAQQKRVKWSDEEINFVGQWCEKMLKQNPANQNNIVSRCLAYIREHMSIAAIFHPNHIVSSGRLKHGLEAYNKRRST